MFPAPRLIALLLVFACALVVSNSRASDDIITLDTLAVSTSKYQWRYSCSAHFEILSAINDSKLVSRIMQRAEQIIGAFEKNNALFRMQRELPAKIIFINDQGIDRYLVLTGKEDLQHARDKPPPGVIASRARSGAARQVSARGFYDGEQAVFLKLITQNYLDGPTPFDERVRENALDLALNYLLVCVDIQTAPNEAPWLVNALNSLRGHTAGGAWRLPDNFESATYKLTRGIFDRPAWFSISDDEMVFGRYCLACEIDLLRKASDFPRGKGEENAAQQKQIWRDYTPAPNAGYSEFLEAAAKETKRARKTFANVNASLTAQREALDFVYYCVFAADAKTRASFAGFVASISKGETNEANFQKYFGAGYDEMRRRVYAFFSQLGKGDADYRENPWGPPAVAVTKFETKDIPPTPEFRASRRSETARILSDWFTLCDAHDMARQTLLKADGESAQAHADPEFMAALGLSEAAHERKFAAVALLEKAMASKKVVRPEAWRTLARLRLELLLEQKSAEHRLTKDELNTIIDPLAEALSQGRMSQQTYVQFAKVWAHTNVKPPKEYLDLLSARCRLWPENAELRESVAAMLKKE